MMLNPPAFPVFGGIAVTFGSPALMGLDLPAVITMGASILLPDIITPVAATALLFFPGSGISAVLCCEQDARTSKKMQWSIFMKEVKIKKIDYRYGQRNFVFNPPGNAKVKLNGYPLSAGTGQSLDEVRNCYAQD
jgi:hypothetical protein